MLSLVNGLSELMVNLKHKREDGNEVWMEVENVAWWDRFIINGGGT